MNRSQPQRIGFTLVELLVVLAIIVLLLAIALPMMTPPLEQRRLRETSRGVVATLAAARDRAISSGRPHGVRLERYIDPATGNVQDLVQFNSCMNISYVAEPVPYAGDSIYSRMVVNNGQVNYAGNVNVQTGSAAVPDAWGSGARARVRYGDQVKLNYCGHLYTVLGGTIGDPASPGSAALFTDTMPHNVTTLPLGTPGAGLPYQVFRQPMKTAAPPYELPESMVVDLSASGMVGAEFLAGANNFGHVTIMFGPNGNVDRVHYGQVNSTTLAAGVRPTSPIYLMIGGVEKVGDFNGNGMPDNAEDLKNLWVSINPQTGLIQSNEMFYNTGGPNDLNTVRTYARTNQSMGGR